MRKLAILLVIALAVWGFIWGSNNWIQTTEYTVTSKKLPESFDGVKIVQVSDLHNAEFGENQSSLIKKVAEAEPDAIFLTGDLVDRDRYDLEVSLTLVDALVKMGEVYYVTGNHEVSLNKIDEITSALEEREVTVLRNQAVKWEREEEAIQVAGIDDPLIALSQKESDYTRQALEETGLTEEFTLLLAHRPEVFDVYAEKQIDIVFSGHAHGGQVRIPGIGGLFAPGQGWFPEMTKGTFQKGNTELILSRGLGNSGFPLRVFNLPEIVVVTLEKE